MFPASPAELKSTTATSATNAQTPLQAQQPQAPSIVLSHIESQSLQVSANIVLTRGNENEKFWGEVVCCFDKTALPFLLQTVS